MVKEYVTILMGVVLLLSTISTAVMSVLYFIGRIKSPSIIMVMASIGTLAVAIMLVANWREL